MSIDLALYSRPMAEAPRDGTEVLLLVYHSNYVYASDADKDQWRQEVRAHWIDHNGGGWTWHGLCGEPMGWRPVEEPRA
jgi:hypothetical protein